MDGMTMTMGANLPAWVGPLAWTYVVLSIVSAVIITVDIVVRQRRQSSRTMEVVWPITALYLGPFALPAYARYGGTTASPTPRRPGTTTLPLVAVHPHPAVIAYPDAQAGRVGAGAGMRSPTPTPGLRLRVVRRAAA